ncbi:MAG: hypothetical protein K0V04_05245 [Deltaproteobacteria bacterium]|nr:hypothetical protein [Deltaproteobacteria bacterium]
MLGLVVFSFLISGCGDDASGTADGSTSEAEQTSSTGESSGPEDTGGSTRGVDTGIDPDDTGTDEDSSTGGPTACELPDTTIGGRVWEDTDASDESTYIAAFDPRVDEGVGNFDVRLLDGTGLVQQTTTCADGRFGFGGTPGATYMVATPDVAAGGCAQRNCPRNLWAAVEAGMPVNILAIGDSLPVEGAQPTFPQRLADRLSPLVDTTVQNTAVSGSTSSQWVPGSVYWTTNVEPNLASADMVLISVGGNDFLNLAAGADLGNIAQVLADAQALLVEVVDNVRTIADEIHTVRPEADVVFTLYVDYSQSSIPPWDLVSLLPAGTIYNLLAGARSMTLPEDEVVVVDVLEPSTMLDGPLDDLLVDPLHFSDAGHDFYADEIFAALGGIVVSADGQVRNMSMR